MEVDSNISFHNQCIQSPSLVLISPILHGPLGALQGTHCGNGSHHHRLAHVAAAPSCVHVAPDLMVLHPVENADGPELMRLPGEGTTRKKPWVFDVFLMFLLLVFDVF